MLSLSDINQADVIKAFYHTSRNLNDLLNSMVDVTVFVVAQKIVV